MEVCGSGKKGEAVEAFLWGPSSCPSFSFRRVFDGSLECASVRHIFLSCGVLVSFGCSNKQL